MSLNAIRSDSKNHFVSIPQKLSHDIKTQKVHFLVQFIALSILTVGIYALTTLVLRQIKKHVLDKQFLPALIYKEPYQMDVGTPIKLLTTDGIQLDARECIFNPHAKKWMLYVCGNGSPYQVQYSRVYELAKDLEVNLLFINYRGVGESGGHLNSSFALNSSVMPLVLDIVTAIEHLRKKGIEEKNITGYGYSLGGGLLLKVAAEYYTEMAVVVDRSYESTTAVAKERSKILGLLIHLLGWYRINSLKLWEGIPASKKLLIFHPLDQTIKYPQSLYYAIKQKLIKNHSEYRIAKVTQSRLLRRKKFGLQSDKKPNHIKLTSTTAPLTKDGRLDYHGIMISEPEVYRKLVAKAKEIMAP